MFKPHFIYPINIWVASTLVSKHTMNIDVQESVQILVFISFGYISRSGTPESYDNYISNWIEQQRDQLPAYIYPFAYLFNSSIHIWWFQNWWPVTLWEMNLLTRMQCLDSFFCFFVDSTGLQRYLGQHLYPTFPWGWLHISVNRDGYFYYILYSILGSSAF